MCLRVTPRFITGFHVLTLENPFKEFNKTVKTSGPWQRQMRGACLFLKIIQQDIRKPTYFSNNDTGVASKLFMGLIHSRQCIFFCNKKHFSCF
jgi:hypothetical protein